MSFGIRQRACSCSSMLAPAAVLVAGALLACGKKGTATLPVASESGGEAPPAAPSARDDDRSASVASAAVGQDLDGSLRLAPSPPPYVAPEVGDLSRNRTLYVVNYAHLDTQWRWTFPLTIRRFLPDTIQQNGDYFGRFPSHIFNFTGASRYQMAKEYFPEQYQLVKQWVNQGRWFPAGNQWEECDVLVPSSESIIRQILMGSRFFRDEFGTESQEFMLPDSFGFPASLPSILAHAGLRGFSTQKLSSTWKPAERIPFHVGKWRGADGNGVIAALDAGDYGAEHEEVLSTSKYWKKRLDENGKAGGLKVDYLYNGTGDRGGAPHETSMKTVEQSVNRAGPVKVVVGPADLMFRHISDAQAAKLPAYQGDLLLREHSAGSLSSQAFIKQLNRWNEVLADAAERASVAADLVGSNPYPAAQLEHAWRLILRSQFHDILAGTSLPKAYEYSWNDEFVAMNEFAYALMDAVAGVARGLDTRVVGVPILVYNPLSVTRTDLVEAALPVELSEEKAVIAVNDRGETLPTQMTLGPDGSKRVLFLATIPSVGFAVYALKAGTLPAGDNELNVSDHVISNERYRVTLDDAGDVSSLYDVKFGRELLGSPIRLAFLTEWPYQFPAWNMDWADRKQPPRSYVAGHPKVQVLETGPLRAEVRIERENEGSSFLQTIRLAAGPAGDRIEFVDRIDWKSSECSLKATFPLRISNPKATYSWDLGTIERGNNDARKYEVPTHSWLDLTDSKGDYGVTVLTGAKYGSDKPTSDTLRLTLLYTPAAPDYFHEQSSQDWGRHQIAYALSGHAGDWRAGKAQWQARRFDQPLLAFAVPRHDGTFGKVFSLLASSTDQVAIQAVKRAEDGKNVVVRLQELLGRAARTQLRTAFSITAAWEMNGVEKRIAPLQPEGKVLQLDFSPYQLRTVEVSLATPSAVVSPSSVPLELDYDLDAISSDTNRADGNFDGNGASYPAEILADNVQVGGVVYRLGSRVDGKKNALIANGQVVNLPVGYTRVYLLAASAGGSTNDVLQMGDRQVAFNVASWSGFVGQWDNRVFAGIVPAATFAVFNDVVRLDPAYLRTDRVAWSGSHRHRAQDGDQPYAYTYLFSYAFELPSGVTTLTLPKDDRLRIFAIAVAKDDNASAVPLVSLWPPLSRDANFHARFDRL
jgi:alpha-mannosidase